MRCLTEFFYITQLWLSKVSTNKKRILGNEIDSIDKNTFFLYENFCTQKYILCCGLDKRTRPIGSITAETKIKVHVFHC